MHLSLFLPSAGLGGVMRSFPLFSPSFEWRITVTSLLVPHCLEENTHTSRRSHTLSRSQAQGVFHFSTLLYFVSGPSHTPTQFTHRKLPPYISNTSLFVSVSTFFLAPRPMTLHARHGETWTIQLSALPLLCIYWRVWGNVLISQPWRAIRTDRKIWVTELVCE